MGSTELKARFEQQLKDFVEQHRVMVLNLNRVEAVIAFIQQELQVMETEEGKETNDESS